MQEIRTVWGGQEPAECASCGSLITAGQPVESDEDGHHYCGADLQCSRTYDPDDARHLGRMTSDPQYFSD